MFRCIGSLCKVVENVEGKKKWVFRCEKWLDKAKDDGKIERELLPSREFLTYKFYVKTSDILYAGTDSFCYMFISFFSRCEFFNHFSYKVN